MSGCQPVPSMQNLPRTVTQENLECLLAQFGPIVSVKLPSLSKQAPNPMAYVQFSTMEAAAAAIQSSKDKRLKMHGATVIVAPYLSFQQRSRCQDETFTNLYVKNLPSNILTDEDLTRMFSSYGNITSSRLVKVGGHQLPGGSAGLRQCWQKGQSAGSDVQPILWICKLFYARGSGRGSKKPEWCQPWNWETGATVRGTISK